MVVLDGIDSILPECAHRIAQNPTLQILSPITVLISVRLGMITMLIIRVEHVHLPAPTKLLVGILSSPMLMTVQKDVWSSARSSPDSMASTQPINVR